jgi:hypothetical protein
MRTHGFLMFVMTAFCICFPVSATVVSTGLISQLTYLGNASQPDRIPLSPVIYRANHNYGCHSAIFQSRPCYHGHFITNSRPEYEQNLAVIYGISCDFSDSTQLNGCTATFTLRKVPLPKGAPYTLEQVFAASLQTLLLYTRGIAQPQPLTIEIKADGMPQPEWVAKYARPYFYTDEEIEKINKGLIESKPLAVPGIKIDDTSMPGVTYLVFDGVQPDPKIHQQNPVFVPFMLEGECDHGIISLVPLWPGNSWTDPLGVIARPDLPYYEKWTTPGSESEDAKPHQSYPLYRTGSGHLQFIEQKSHCTVEVLGGQMSTQQFATFLYSCLVTFRPTEERPLHVVCRYFQLNEEYLNLLPKEPAGDRGFSCTFAFDAKTMKLTKGVIPGYEINFDFGHIGIVGANKNEDMGNDEEPAPSWIASHLSAISTDLPVLTEKDSPEVMIKAKTKLMKWVIDGKGDINDILHTMLTLNYYVNDAWFFENLWWRDKNRVTRAVAGYLAEKGFVLQGDAIRPQLEKQLEERSIDPWQRQIRGEEISYGVQARISKAIQAWNQRCEEASADPPPPPTDNK